MQTAKFMEKVRLHAHSHSLKHTKQTRIIIHIHKEILHTNAA